MIDAVLLFGALNVLFEFVLLCMMPPRLRLRLLGNEAASNALHVFFLHLTPFNFTFGLSIYRHYVLRCLN